MPGFEEKRLLRGVWSEISSRSQSWAGMEGGWSGPNEDAKFMLLRIQLDVGRIVTVVDLPRRLVC